MKDKHSIIPIPQNLILSGDYLNLDSIKIKSINIENPFLNNIINDINKLKPVSNKASSLKELPILWEKTANLNNSNESYSLNINPHKILIKSSSEAGLIWAIQSLRQWLYFSETGSSIPCVEIKDHPTYTWRGLLLDCCRHFMPIPVIKQILDALSFYKMNVFHWHLTEDQGWRIEIDAYPKLMEISAYRGHGNNKYGGYYTKTEIREIIQYAKERGIEVIPEIELPGHSMAALAAYPELSCTGGPFSVTDVWGIHEDVYCAGKDASFTFLQKVLQEVIELFPSPYIHIGGDEVPKTRWKKCPDCQKRMQSENLRNEDQLQFYFINRINQFLQKQGKTLIGWDEILDGGDLENSIIQYWRAFEGTNQLRKAINKNHKVILSPTSHCYLDYTNEQISLEKAYSFSPEIYNFSEEENRKILGIQGNMWTERAPQDIVLKKIFPRLIALAEIAWINGENKNFKEFKQRLIKHKDYLSPIGITLGDGI